jgi:hypothetical protein
VCYFISRPDAALLTHTLRQGINRDLTSQVEFFTHVASNYFGLTEEIEQMRRGWEDERGVEATMTIRVRQ